MKICTVCKKKMEGRGFKCKSCRPESKIESIKRKARKEARAELVEAFNKQRILRRSINEVAAALDLADAAEVKP